MIRGTQLKHNKLAKASNNKIDILERKFNNPPNIDTNQNYRKKYIEGDGFVDSVSNFITKAIKLATPGVSAIRKAISTIAPAIKTGFETYNEAIAAKINKERLKQEQLKTQKTEREIEITKNFEKMLKKRDEHKESTADWYNEYKDLLRTFDKTSEKVGSSAAQQVGCGFAIIK